MGFDNKENFIAKYKELKNTDAKIFLPRKYNLAQTFLEYSKENSRTQDLIDKKTLDDRWGTGI